MNKRVARDDARLPGVLALRTSESSLVELIPVAVLTDASGQEVANVAVHVDLEDPVTNLISLGLREQVLLGQWDLIRNWDVSVLELSVLRDHVGLRVNNSVPQVDVPVEEDEGHVILVDGAIGIASIEECFVCTDVLAIAEKRRAEFGIASVKVVPRALSLQEK